ncbi:glycine cleavage system protein GcvH [bacterium]|nr:glycine cleavage system protein GcvH [bacterium]
MSDVPNDLKYTEDHEWVRIEGDEVVVGVTDYAQGELGDVVFLEFPEVDDEVEQGQPFGSIEAVKTVADLYAPLTGKVTAINSKLDDEPETVNSDPYGEGWLIKIAISDRGELDSLMDAETYQEHIG